MTIALCVDELHRNADMVVGATNAAFENIGHPKLLSDLAQVARDAALVLHHRRPANHFEIFDL